MIGLEKMEDQYYDWPLFKRILRYLKPYRYLVLTAIGLLFIVSMLNLVGPYLTKIVIDDYVKVSNLDGLDKIAILFLLVLTVALICQFCQTLLMQYIGQRVMMDIRGEVFAHVHKMSFKFFDNNPVGKLITRVVNDVEVLNEMLTSGLILVFNDLFTLIGIAFMLIYLDWRIALVVCLIFPPLFVATQVYRKRARDALRKSRGYVTELNSFLQENLSGMYTVQLFNREVNHKDRFCGINHNRLKEDLRSLHYNCLYLPSIDVLSAFGIGLAIYYGGGRVVQDEIQLGVLVAFLQYIQKFFEPIRDLAEKFNIIQSAMASSERIFEFLDTPEESPHPSEPIAFANIKGHVEFQNVAFAYKPGETILKNISFSINQGESLAIIGATGSGKTTIINALCRFYEIKKGNILIDGVSIQNIDKRQLRRQIALVQQDVFLFSGKIADNIRLGNPDLEQDKIESITRMLDMHDFIEGLPDGYNHEIQEKGASLSIGQRQALAFARALAFDPKIIILDEATSSIDTETEQHIQKATQKLMEGRTSIVIAHRLSTLKHVDKALVLKNGEIQEFGSRQELLKKKGIYYRLVTRAVGS